MIFGPCGPVKLRKNSRLVGGMFLLGKFQPDSKFSGMLRCILDFRPLYSKWTRSPCKAPWYEVKLRSSHYCPPFIDASSPPQGADNSFTCGNQSTVAFILSASCTPSKFLWRTQHSWSFPCPSSGPIAHYVKRYEEENRLQSNLGSHIYNREKVLTGRPPK